MTSAAMSQETEGSFKSWLFGTLTYCLLCLLQTEYSRAQIVSTYQHLFDPFMLIKYLPDNPALVSWPRKQNIWSPVDVRNGDCWQTDLTRLWEHSLLHGVCSQGSLR